MKNLLRILSLSLLLLGGVRLQAASPDPSGVWKFTAEAGGRTMESTLTLHWAEGQLSGAIDNRAGKVAISEASFEAGVIKFTVVREIGKRLRKKTFTVHYSGRLEGDTITGTIDAKGREQQPVTVAWNARRSG